MCVGCVCLWVCVHVCVCTHMLTCVVSIWSWYCLLHLYSRDWWEALRKTERILLVFFSPNFCPLLPRYFLLAVKFDSLLKIQGFFDFFSYKYWNTWDVVQTSHLLAAHLLNSTAFSLTQCVNPLLCRVFAFSDFLSYISMSYLLFPLQAFTLFY